MKKILLTGLAIIGGVLTDSFVTAATLNRMNDSSKTVALDRASLQKLEAMIIEEYLEETKEKNQIRPDMADVKIFNDNDELVFEGSSQTAEARRLIMKADLITSLKTTEFYLIKNTK